MEIKIQTGDQEVSESKSRNLSPLQKAYRDFIKARLSALDKTSPFEGTPDEVAEFFAEVAEDWDAHKKTLDIEE